MVVIGLLGRYSLSRPFSRPTGGFFQNHLSSTGRPLYFTFDPTGAPLVGLLIKRYIRNGAGSGVYRKAHHWTEEAGDLFTTAQGGLTERTLTGLVDTSFGL